MSTWMDVAFFSNGYQPSCGKDKAPIFSLYSTTNAIPPSTSMVHIAVKKLQLPLNAAKAEDLDDNVLQHIFSFLNFKSITTMRAVCATWMENADANRCWLSLYDAKYGIRSDDPLLQTTKTSEMNFLHHRSLQQDWKRLFMSRWLIGREIRFRYSRVDPTWKVRICPFVGCLHVLSSPLQLQKHCKVHEKKQTKKSVHNAIGDAICRKRKRPNKSETASNASIK